MALRAGFGPRTVILRPQLQRIVLKIMLSVFLFLNYIYIKMLSGTSYIDFYTALSNIFLNLVDGGALKRFNRSKQAGRHLSYDFTLF